MNFITPDWPAPDSIRAYTTLRDALPMNLNQEEREKKLKQLLSLPETPIWLTQKHGANAIEARHENVNEIADAAYASTPHRVCIVFTADCLPVLICNKQGTKVAAIHAGWRGLSAGIIENTLTALNLDPHDLLIWLGPAIGPSKFEVGEDVYHAFVSKHEESEQGFRPFQNGKWLADLYVLAKIRLKLQGISQIYGGSYCTFTQDDLFYSYRRDKTQTGRMASLIWIEN